MKLKNAMPVCGVVCLVAAAFLFATAAGAQSAAQEQQGKTRVYFIAADEVEWNYVPSGMDKSMGMPLEGIYKMYSERGPHNIGSTYRKAVYREYTDGTFTHLKPRAPEWEHTGILGPILRAEVGDTIRVTFKNNATQPYSMHPHGVFYEKDSEGSVYADGTSGADKEDDAVPPGGQHIYTWKVPERAGPGPNDPSSIVWLYHSHTNEMKDVNSGLVGAIIVTRRGMADADGKPKDVDREFVCLFMIFDENFSWYLDHNIQAYTTDPKGVKKSEILPTDDVGNLAPIGTGFIAANLRFAINGYLFGNGPVMTMKQGERVRWYLMALGEGISLHTPHWHGNTVMQEGRRTDVVPLLPAQMVTVDMTPDDPGTWLFHCHLDEHMASGMSAFYKVEPR